MRTDRYNGGKPYHIPTLQLETQTCTHTHILIITHAYAMQVGNIEKYGSSTLVVGRVLVTHVQDKYLEKRSDGAKAVRNQDMATVARLGGLEYGTIGNRWTLQKDANWNEKHW